MSTDQTQNLAGMLAEKEPTADLRIGVVTEIDTGVARKVRTDQTGLAWLARSEDINLVVGDRVWMIKQRSTWIVAGRLSGGPSTTICKRKTTNQPVTNSVTPVSDLELTYFLPVGQYRIELIAHCTSTSGTPNIKMGWVFSGTVINTSRDCLGPGTSTTDPGATTVMRSSAHGFATMIPYGIGPSASADTASIREDLTFEITVAGTLTLQWAQNTANAAATNMTSSSRLYVTPLQVV